MSRPQYQQEHDAPNHPCSDYVIETMADIIDQMCERNDAYDYSNTAPTPFTALSVPHILIVDYLERLTSKSECSEQSLLVAMVLLDRFMGASENEKTLEKKIYLYSHTVHRILLAALLVALKSVDDFYVSNKLFARIGGITLKEINALERKFLLMIEWNSNVKAEEYEKYKQHISGEHEREAQVGGEHEFEAQVGGEHEWEAHQIGGQHEWDAHQIGDQHEWDAQQHGYQHEWDAQQVGEHEWEAQQVGEHEWEGQQVGEHEWEARQLGSQHEWDTQQVGEHEWEAHQVGEYEWEAQQVGDVHKLEAQQVGCEHEWGAQQVGQHEWVAQLGGGHGWVVQE